MPDVQPKSRKEWQWLDREDSETPINPIEKQRHTYKGDAWKYYLLIKPDLQEWWDEFNGKLDKRGKVYFKNLGVFIRSKTRNGKQKEWLRYMLGPKPEDLGEKKQEIPWLGDWSKRRKNGYWSIDNKIQLKGLKKAIESNADSMDAIKACAPFLIQEMLQYTKLQEKVHQVFGGEPFLDEAPTSKPNVHRFRTYMHMLGKITGLKVRLVQEWMRVNGIDPRNPHEMWDMATLAQLSGSIGAAGALTGFTAGMSLQPGQQPAFGSQPQNVVSPTAYLLAEHLTEHARIFKKPLPPLSEEGVVKEAKPKESSKDKTNGKSNGKHVV